MHALCICLAGWLSQGTLKYKISPLPLVARDWTSYCNNKLFQGLGIHPWVTYNKDICCEVIALHASVSCKLQLSRSKYSKNDLLLGQLHLSQMCIHNNNYGVLYGSIPHLHNM